MVTTFTPHLLGVLGLAVVLLGPIPLALIAARADDTPRGSAAGRMLVALLVWCLWQMALAVVLGATGWLRPGPLLAGEAALGTIGLMRHKAWPSLRPAPPLRPSEWAVLAALAVLGARLGLQLALQPITEHDSLGYHLTAVARWLQAGALVPLERTDYVGRYPYGWELVCGLFILPFGDDFLVALPNLAVWTLLGVAVFVCGRQLGAPRLHALAAALCLLGLVVTRELVPTARTDLAVAAFFMAGVASALASTTVGVLAATALLAGTKTSGLIYAGLLLGVGAAHRARGRGRSTGWRAVALPALLVAGFWYARNLAATGNPLGPVRVAVGDLVLFAGDMEPASLRATTLAAVFDASWPAHWRLLAGAAAAKLRLPFALLLVAALSALVPPYQRPARLATVVTLLGLCAALYVTTPFSATLLGEPARLTPWMSENVRFALPALGLLAAVAAAGAGQHVGTGPVLAAVAFVVAGTTTRLTPLAIAVVGVLAAGGIAARRRRAPAAVIVTLLLAGLAAVGSWTARQYRAEARARHAGPALDRLAEALPPGGTIAYVVPTRAYLLYGPRLEQHVAYLPGKGLDREAWTSRLRDRRIALVAIGPLQPHHRRRPEVAWLTDPSGPFERVAGTDPARETVLYRLR